MKQTKKELLESIEQLKNESRCYQNVLSSIEMGSKNNTVNMKRTIQIKKDGGWYYIPSNLMTFNIALQFLMKYDRYEGKYDDRKRFIDCGCGIGMKMKLAQMFGYDTFGLEIDTNQINSFKRMFGHYSLVKNYNHTYFYNDNKMMKQNILKFKYYNDFDIIYYYRPFDNAKKQEQFEKLIADNIKVDGYIFSVYRNDRVRSKYTLDRDKRFKIVFDVGEITIFKKVK